MSLADLDGLAGDGERDGLLSEDSEVARSRWGCRLDLGRGESDFGESGMDSGEAWWSVLLKGRSAKITNHSI